MTAKISVIIPAFNCAEYISDAIASVIAQSLAPHEIIVVDDGSTDNTGQILADFAHKKVIKYFKQSNQGPSAARNNGVNEATGDLICFLDADDLLLPECIQQVNDFFQSTDEPAILFQNFYKQDISDPVIPSSMSGHWETGSLWQEMSKYGEMKSTSLDDVWYLNNGYFVLLLHNFPQLNGSAVPKSLFLETGGFNTSMTMGEDRDFCLRVSLMSHVAINKQPSSVYRRRSGSLVERPELLMFSKVKTPERNLNLKFLSASNIRVFKKFQRYHYLDYAWHLFREKRLVEAHGVLLDCKKNAGWSVKHLMLYLLTVIPRPMVTSLLLIKQKF